ncbi:MAG: hypothetical protein M3469_03095 [Actinomycetota bacterium]|nr:hypothetical protein [Actinomycetota bacterium]
MDDHVDALKRFGASWRDLTFDQAAQTRAVIAGDAAAPATLLIERAYLCSSDRV